MVDNNSFRHLLNNKDEFSVDRKRNIDDITDLLKDTTAKVEVCNVVFFDESNITYQALQNLKIWDASINVYNLTHESYKALKRAHVAIFTPTNQVLKNRY